MNIKDYLSNSTLENRLKKVQNILDNLYDAVADPSFDFSRSGYSFDDGQTRVTTNYRSLKDIEKGIQFYQNLEGLIVRRLTNTFKFRLIHKD